MFKSFLLNSFVKIKLKRKVQEINNFKTFSEVKFHVSWLFKIIYYFKYMTKRKVSISQNKIIHSFPHPIFWITKKFIRFISRGKTNLTLSNPYLLPFYYIALGNIIIPVYLPTLAQGQFLTWAHSKPVGAGKNCL